MGSIIAQTETDQLKENTEVELKQVSVCGDSNMTKNNEVTENKVITVVNLIVR